MDLQKVVEFIEPAIGENAIYLTGRLPMAEIGPFVECLSELFQGYAICALLTTGDPEQFREYLLRSGCLLRYFRRKSSVEGNVHDRHLALSRSEAFLDAVVAGDWGLARDLARLAPRDWVAEWEYEDDFCYFQFLHALAEAQGRGPPAELTTVLDRFERVLDGAQSARLQVCRALLDADQPAVCEQLAALLAEKQQRDDKLRTAVVPSKFLFWPRSFVSIEGLALLKFAELAGLRIDDSFPLCPAPARLAEMDRPYEDKFAELERLLASGE